MQRSRRRVLAASASLLAAGCVGTDTESDRPDQRSPTSSPNESETADCTSGIVLTTGPYAPADDLPVSLNETERSIVERAASDGPAAYTTDGSRPLRDGVIVRHDGEFYRTASEIVAVDAIPAYEMDVSWEAGQTAPEGATVVHFGELPESDRAALESAVLNPESEGDGDGLPQRQLSIRAYPAPYPDGGTDSRLVGNRTWVRWRDRTMRVDVAGDSEETKERRTFEYTLERVATDESALRSFAAERYLVALDDVPEAQRSILTAAIDGRYEECAPASTALSALRERLSEAEQLPHPNDDAWYVALDGERSLLQISEWVR
ncbi:hypothetical protein GOC74_11805 [Halomicrobium mukohataei]|uniref:Lipoprotein n=1 Tax=Halomicrobium mukohataei TaxID=57705 RepID=A0A847UGB7_9EURY|nr:hypothetical protein [Halomicrobium mukohataei]NLV10610.1 hypothetical protein [Halomicrobium mukohataei]